MKDVQKSSIKSNQKAGGDGLLFENKCYLLKRSAKNIQGGHNTTQTGLWYLSVVSRRI